MEHLKIYFLHKMRMFHCRVSLPVDIYIYIFSDIGTVPSKETHQSTRSAALSLFLNLFIQKPLNPGEGWNGFCLYTIAAKKKSRFGWSIYMGGNFYKPFCNIYVIVKVDDGNPGLSQLGLDGKKLQVSPGILVLVSPRISAIKMEESWTLYSAFFGGGFSIS